MPIRLTVLFLLLAVLAVPVVQAAGGVTQVQFRDLFFRGGKPSSLAVKMTGNSIEMTGFIAEAPTMESPFLVLVGTPTNFCPYCNGIDDKEHLPYVLVYPSHEFSHDEFKGRTRVRVAGQLYASHDYENVYGIHNDVRIDAAVVSRDARAINPVLVRRKAAIAAERAKAAGADASDTVVERAPADPRGRPAVAPVIDED